MVVENGIRPEITVVVCTYNRAELLRGCLESLAAQTAPGDAFEVIVVDNNSTDGTPAAARSFEGRVPGLRVVPEAAQGLSSARNRGWREARGAFVAFLDDDARATERWVETLVRIVGEHAPDVAGGPIRPFYTSPKPAWFKDEYELRIHQAESGWMADGYVSGSNFAVRRGLKDEIGEFDTRYGMSGTALAYGEETELLRRARGAGKRVYYALDLEVLHHVPAEKMDLLFAMSAAFRRGATTHELWWEGRVGYSELRTLYVALDGFFSGLAEALDGRELDRERYPYRENYVFENCLPHLSTLGVLAGHAAAHGAGGHSFLAFVRGWVTRRLRELLKRARLG